VALTSGGKTYYKLVEELTEGDMAARIAADRLREAWLKEQRDRWVGYGEVPEGKAACSEVHSSALRPGYVPHPSAADRELGDHGKRGPLRSLRLLAAGREPPAGGPVSDGLRTSGG
jgi:hypothetical protein